MHILFFFIVLFYMFQIMQNWMKQFKLGHLDHCLSPAVRYLVAPLFNGDTLPVIAGEGPRAAGRHLHLDLLGVGPGRAGLVDHVGEVELLLAQQQGDLRGKTEIIMLNYLASHIGILEY